MSDCGHCWHSTGMMLASYPAQYEDVCCRCGAVRIYAKTRVRKVEGHGPFLCRTNEIEAIPADEIVYHIRERVGPVTNGKLVIVGDGTTTAW